MMNRYSFLVLLLVLFHSYRSFGQDTTKIKMTQFERFSSEDGVLKKLESHRIGKVKGFVMYKKTTTNVETGKFYNAVEISEKGGFWIPKFGSIIIDEDEIASTIKTLKYFASNVMTDACKEECPTYLYETKGGVYIYCTKVIGAYASNWHAYMGKTLSSASLGSIDLDSKELESLIALLETYR